MTDAKTCLQCTASLAGKRKIARFCSRSCSARYSNQHRAPRATRQATHCHAGHPFDEENLYTDKTGKRHCRACKRKRDRGYKRVRPSGWAAHPSRRNRLRSVPAAPPAPASTERAPWRPAGWGPVQVRRSGEAS